MKWTDGDVARVLEEAAHRPLGKSEEAGAHVEAGALPPQDLLPKLKESIPFPAPAGAQRRGPSGARALLALAAALAAGFVLGTAVRFLPARRVAGPVVVVRPEVVKPPTTALEVAPTVSTEPLVCAVPPVSPCLTRTKEAQRAPSRVASRAKEEARAQGPATLAKEEAQGYGPTTLAKEEARGYGPATLVLRALDTEGLPMPGVVVEVRREGEPSLSETTDAQGYVRMTRVLPGAVDVAFYLHGFERVPLKRVDVAAGAIVRADAVLRPRADLAMSVVSGDAPVVHLSQGIARESLSYMQLVEGSSPRVAPPPPHAAAATSTGPPGFDSFAETAEHPLTTFALDVDTGSYSRARQALLAYRLPIPGEVRTEEFVNALPYSDPGPSSDDFAVTAEVSTHPFAEKPGNWLLRIAIQSRSIDVKSRKPARLTFVIDTSGSMKGDDRLGLVKRSLRRLVAELGPEDRVGVVAFGTKARLVLAPTADHGAILRAVDGLETDGSTNTEEGLMIGYAAALGAFDGKASNRVVLCSDGVSNTGATSIDGLLARIKDAAALNVELSTLGFGAGNYNDRQMEQLADRGNGRYAFVDTMAEAERVFGAELSGTLETVASDARVQVELNPRVVKSYRLLGYENRAMKDEDFRDDTKDAGEVGAGHAVTALYEIESLVEPSGGLALGSVHLRWKPADGRSPREIEETITTSRRGVVPWERASASLRLASVVAELAERLRGRIPATHAGLAAFHARAEAALKDEVRRPEVVELVYLVDTAVKLLDQTATNETKSGSDGGV